MLFAYTLQIPAGCKVSDTRRYREMTEGEQKIYIRDLLLLATDNNENTLNYEKHKDNRVHIHGILKVDTEIKMKFIQMKINMFLDYSLENKKIFYYKPITSIIGWNTYCNKDCLLHCDLPPDSPVR